MRALLTDAHVRLLRGLRGVIAADGCLGPWLQPGSGPSLVIEDFDSEPWASLTFSGTRHRLDIRLTGPTADVEAAVDRLETLLLEPDIDMPGHFLAEIQLVDRRAEIHRDGHMGLAIQIEALTIEE